MFERTPPHCVYVPSGSDWSVTATTSLTLAVCTAPGKGGHPAQEFGFQRVFTEDGVLDETMAAADGDVVLVPRGHHPCAAPYGYEMYYLNVMAGPLRKWRFQNHPDHDWIFQRDHN